MKKTAYNVTLRETATRELHERTIIAADEATAGAMAIEKARAGLKVMADRKYAQFEVVSCIAAAATP